MIDTINIQGVQVVHFYFAGEDEKEITRGKREEYLELCREGETEKALAEHMFESGFEDDRFDERGNFINCHEGIWDQYNVKFKDGGMATVEFYDNTSDFSMEAEVVENTPMALEFATNWLVDDYPNEEYIDAIKKKTGEVL